MGHGLPARRGDTCNLLKCAPDHYGDGMADRNMGKWGSTPTAMGPLPDGLCPPSKILCWPGAVSNPKWTWSWSFSALGWAWRQEQREECSLGFLLPSPCIQLPGGWRVLWLAEHCRRCKEGWAGECWRKLLTGHPYASETRTFLGIKQKKTKAFPAIAKQEENKFIPPSKSSKTSSWKGRLQTMIPQGRDFFLLILFLLFSLSVTIPIILVLIWGD